MGDYKEAMIDKGQWWEFGQDTGVTPYSLREVPWDFKESQDLSLKSHQKDGAFRQYSIPVTLLGC